MSSPLLSLPGMPSAAQAPSAPASSSSSARARDAAPASDADSFGAALARTRDARSRTAADASDEGASAPAPRRRGAGAHDAERQDNSPAELLAMAMLTPAFHARSAQPRNLVAQGSEAMARTATGAAADALASTAAAGDQVAIDAATQAAAGTKDAAADPQLAQAQAQAADDKQRQRADAGKPAPGQQADALADARAGKAQEGSAPAVPVAALPTTAPFAASATAATARNADAPTAGAARAATAGAGTAAPEPAALALHAQEAALPQESADGESPATPLPSFAMKLASAEAAGATSATATAPLPRLHVATPVGSEGWGADLGTQMIRLGADGQHVAELTLNPAGLGPLKVTLTLGDNQAQAMFVSAHESVRRAVEAALPQLRETLAGQGIQLGQASVDASTQQQQQQQQAFGEPRQFAGGHSAARGVDAQRAPAALATDARASVATPRRSGIDTFA